MEIEGVILRSGGVINAAKENGWTVRELPDGEVEVRGMAEVPKNLLGSISSLLYSNDEVVAVEFERLFGSDPNFQSESGNTKSWMLKAFLAGIAAGRGN